MSRLRDDLAEPLLVFAGCLVLAGVLWPSVFLGALGALLILVASWWGAP
jgi:hypothetical protein